MKNTCAYRIQCVICTALLKLYVNLPILITSGSAITVDINIVNTALCRTHDHNLRLRDLMSAEHLSQNSL